MAESKTGKKRRKRPAISSAGKADGDREALAKFAECLQSAGRLLPEAGLGVCSD